MRSARTMVAAAVLALGACGGGDDDTGGTTTTSEPSVDCSDPNIPVHERRDAGCSLEEVIEAGPPDPPDPGGTTTTTAETTTTEDSVPPAADTSLPPPCGRAIQLLAEADPDAEEPEVAASLEEDFGGMDRIEQQDNCGTIVLDLCEGPTSETFDRPLGGCG